MIEVRDAARDYADESVEHAHHTVPVQVWVDIDEGVAPLVVALNEIDGLRTFASCQGHLTSKVETRADVLLGRLEDGPSWEWLANVIEERCGAVGWELRVWGGSDTAQLFVTQERIVHLAVGLGNVRPRLSARYPGASA